MNNIPMGLIGYVAMQCTFPATGQRGTWLYRGDKHQQPDAALSPRFDDYIDLIKWCQANGWKSYGYAYVYEPAAEQKGKVAK